MPKTPNDYPRPRWRCVREAFSHSGRIKKIGNPEEYYEPSPCRTTRPATARSKGKDTKQITIDGESDCTCGYAVIEWATSQDWRNDDGRPTDEAAADAGDHGRDAASRKAPAKVRTARSKRRKGRA